MSGGGSMIPASQRADGSWRKPRRVKDGYVPQDEVPLYESKGKQFQARRGERSVPVGLTPEIVAEARAKKKPQHHHTTANVRDVTQALAGVSISTDPAKRLKNLRKKLREIQVLEAKLNSGEIQNPERDQLEKVHNREHVLSEIAALEATLAL